MARAFFSLTDVLKALIILLFGSCFPRKKLLLRHRFLKSEMRGNFFDTTTAKKIKNKAKWNSRESFLILIKCFEGINFELKGLGAARRRRMHELTTEAELLVKPNRKWWNEAGKSKLTLLGQLLTLRWRVVSWQRNSPSVRSDDNARHTRLALLGE